MIPAEFEYRCPGTAAEATALLAELPGAKLLAGGMSLIPALKHRLLQPDVLVDIGRLPGLDQISERRGRIRIGARVTHGALERSPELAAFPAVAETARLIGDVQVRNRGTLGGSLVHADPAADWPALFLALDGQARCAGPKGERTIPAAEFFAGMLTSSVAPDELLLEVELRPQRKRAGSAYCKLRQPASGFALVGVAAEVALDRRGRCEHAAVAITGVNPVPFRAQSVETRLVGGGLDAATLIRALGEIEELDPMADLHASAEYRCDLARVFARRALLSAAERAAA